MYLFIYVDGEVLNWDIRTSNIFLCKHFLDVDGLSNFFERVSFKEHGSAYGSMGHTRTEYIQILRIVYMQQQEQLETATPKMMFHKHFSPVRVRKGMETQSGDDAEPLEYLFEDLRHVEQKINAWLSYSS